MTDMANDDLSEDVLRGHKEIAEFLGEPERRTQYLIEKRLIPFFKLGGRVYARKRRLREHYAQLEAEEP